MSESLSRTRSDTYTSTDIANVIRRVAADLRMIAQSTRAISESEATNYAYDIEALAQAGYLASVDLTLLSGGWAGREIAAVTYRVNVTAGGLVSSRPGGVMWPAVSDPYLRIVLRYTSAYDGAAEAAMARRLKCSWSPTNVDTRHLTLSQTSGRDYASGGFGMERKDFQ